MNNSINLFDKIFLQFKNFENLHNSTIINENIKNDNFKSITNYFFDCYNKQKKLYDKLIIFYNSWKEIVNDINKFIYVRKLRFKGYISPINDFFENKNNRFMLNNSFFEDIREDINSIKDKIDKEYSNFDIILLEVSKYLEVSNELNNELYKKKYTLDINKKYIMDLNNYIIKEFLNTNIADLNNVINLCRYFEFDDKNEENIKFYKFLNFDDDKKHRILSIKLILNNCLMNLNLLETIEFSDFYLNNIDLFVIINEINIWVTYFNNKNIILKYTNFSILYKLLFKLIDKKVICSNEYWKTLEYIDVLYKIKDEKHYYSLSFIFKYSIDIKNIYFWEEILETKINYKAEKPKKSEKIGIFKSIVQTFSSIKENVNKSYLLSDIEENEITQTLYDNKILFTTGDILNKLILMNLNIKTIKNIIFEIFKRYNFSKVILLELFNSNKKDITNWFLKNDDNIDFKYKKFNKKKYNIDTNIKLYKIFKFSMKFLDISDIKKLILINKFYRKYFKINFHIFLKFKLMNSLVDKVKFWSNFSENYNNIKFNANVSFLSNSNKSLIINDTKRSFTKGKDSKKLENILLRLFNYFNIQLKYYQGFNFIVKTILNYLKDEEISYNFCIIWVQKLLKYDFIYKSKFKLLLDFLDIFIKEQYSELNNILFKNQIDLKTLIIDNIICLFCNGDIYLEYKFQIIEYFILNGFKGLIIILCHGLDYLNKNLLDYEIKINSYDNLIILIKNLFNNNLFDFKKTEENKIYENFFIKNFIISKSFKSKINYTLFKIINKNEDVKNYWKDLEFEIQNFYE